MRERSSARIEIFVYHAKPIKILFAIFTASLWAICVTNINPLGPNRFKDSAELSGICPH
jgi:hypothetical protein